jgi:hypothetical protein
MTCFHSNIVQGAWNWKSSSAKIPHWIYVLIEIKFFAYIDPPPERADRGSDIRVLMDVDELFILKDRYSLFCCLGEL